MRRMFELTFTAVGTPKPKGSTTSYVPKRKDGSLVTRPNGSAMVVTHDQTGAAGKVWASAVSGAAFEAMVTEGKDLIRKVPLVIEIDFYLLRPANQYRTGKFAHLLKPDAPSVPCVMPDVDKLVRGVLDALTNVVYGDDGQIAAVTARKFFGDPARAEVRVAQYDPDPPATAVPAVMAGQLSLA